MFEKCVKDDLNNKQINAVTLAKAGIYVSPSYDTKSMMSKQRMWQQFMDSLDWDKLSDLKRKQSPEKVKEVFKSLGIPIAGEKDKGSVNK